MLLSLACADSPQLTEPPLIVVNNPGQTTPVRTVITSIARCDVNTARRDTVLFRSLPQEICVGDNGSFSRSGATISTLYWQNTVGGRREGKSVSYTFNHEGSYDIEAQAIDSTGVTGDTKWISIRIDLSKLKTDTVTVIRIVPRVDTVTIIRIDTVKVPGGIRVDTVKVPGTIRVDTVRLPGTIRVDTVKLPGTIRVDTVKIIRVDTVKVPGGIRVDTVRIPKVDTLRITRVDTLTWRRPVAEIRLIGPDVREVGDEVCAEEISAASPHGLAITGRHWIRDDNSRASGPKTCLRAEYPGDMIFVYQVVDEKGNASLAVSVHLHIKPKSEPPPQCPADPNIFYKVEHVGEKAEALLENAGNCSHRVTLKVFREAPNKSRGGLVSSDEAVIGPKGSATARIILRARVDSCEYFGVIYIDGKEVKEFPLRSHLCNSGS